MTDSTYRLPVKEIVNVAWAKVKGAKGSFWAITGLYLLFILALFAIGFFASSTGKITNPWLIILFFNVVVPLIQLISGASLLYLGIKRAQNVQVSYKLVKDILNVRTLFFFIGLYFLQIIIFLPGIIAAGVGATLTRLSLNPSTSLELLSSAFYLAGAFIFIYLSVRMCLAYGVVLDQKLNSWAAIKVSFQATRGNVWNIIKIYLINIFIALFCFITAGIGLIWGLPWLMIIYGELYQRLVTPIVNPIG